MNILLINHYAGSLKHGMEYRPYYLSREWVRRGHNVTIIASSISHVRTTSPVVSDSLTEEVIDGIRYWWLRTPAYATNGIRRALNIFSFAFQLYWYRNRIISQLLPDVVIASSTHPLDNVPAHFISKQCGAKHIYEVHDLWPLSLIELGGMSRRHPFIVLIQWAENFSYKHADRIVSMLPCAKSHMMEHGMSGEKFVFIPNGVNVNDWTETSEIPAEHSQLIRRLRAEGKFLVAYAGAHGVANALHSVVEAAALMQKENVAFLLVGHGPEKESLQREVQNRQLKNVFLLPSVPKQSIPSLLNAMDALYIGLQDQSLFRFGVSPNKLIDYMMAAKPVIQAIRAGNDMVAESACGISIEPENPPALVEAVRTLMNLPSSELERMGSRGREHVRTHHDYEILARQFLEVCEPRRGAAVLGPARIERAELTEQVSA